MKIVAGRKFIYGETILAVRQPGGERSVRLKVRRRPKGTINPQGENRADRVAFDRDGAVHEGQPRNGQNNVIDVVQNGDGHRLHSWSGADDKPIGARPNAAERECTVIGDHASLSLGPKFP